jgi:hypothetical protein
MNFKTKKDVCKYLNLPEEYVDWDGDKLVEWSVPKKASMDDMYDIFVQYGEPGKEIEYDVVVQIGPDGRPVASFKTEPEDLSQEHKSAVLGNAYRLYDAIRSRDLSEEEKQADILNLVEEIKKFSSTPGVREFLEGIDVVVSSHQGIMTTLGKALHSLRRSGIINPTDLE